MFIQRDITGIHTGMAMAMVTVMGMDTDMNTGITTRMPL